MAALKHTHFFFILILQSAILLLPRSVNCGEGKDNLLQGINSYRASLNLSTLTKNKNADCLAERIANDLEDRPCPAPNTVGTPQPHLATDKSLKKCKIDRKSTTDSIIMPVCVPKRVITVVLTNYTKTPYSRYLNNSGYSGIGIGSENDWMVVILTTNKTGGSLTGGGISHVRFGLLHIVVGVASVFALVL